MLLVHLHVYRSINPLPHMAILGYRDMMSKIWINGDTLSDCVENIVGKGEIARYEQFLLFPQCFQKLSVVDSSKWVSVEQSVKT